MNVEICTAAVPRTQHEHALVTVWAALSNGEAKIVESFSTDDRIGLVLVQDREAAARPLKPRHLCLWDELLLSGQQKVAGINQGVATSTVACTIKQTLRHLGLQCLPSRVPLLVVIAAYAARERVCLSPVRVAEQDAGNLLYRTVTIGGPRTWLSARLTPCESQVAGLHVAGKTHLEISSLSGTAPRTVANHLAAVYRKLGVGSRLQFQLLLAREYALGNVQEAVCDAPTKVSAELSEVRAAAPRCALPSHATAVKAHAAFRPVR